MLAMQKSYALRNMRLLNHVFILNGEAKLHHAPKLLLSTRILQLSLLWMCGQTGTDCCTKCDGNASAAAAAADGGWLGLIGRSGAEERTERQVWH